MRGLSLIAAAAWCLISPGWLGADPVDYAPTGDSLKKYSDSAKAYAERRLPDIEKRREAVETEFAALSERWSTELVEQLQGYNVESPVRPKLTVEPWEKYDRGADIGEFLRNIFELHFQYLPHYFSDCSTFPTGIRPIGICVRYDFPYKITVHVRWDYYIPVQALETSEVPFATSLFPKVVNKAFLGLSNNILKSVTVPLLGFEIWDFNLRSKIKMWGAQIGHDAFKDVDVDYEGAYGFDLEELFRNGIPEHHGYTNTEYHLLNNYFEEIWSFIGAGQWCHNKHSKFLPWMSEAPWGILFSRFPTLTYLTKLREETMMAYDLAGAAHSCINREYAKAQGHTPNNILSGRFQDILSNPQAFVQAQLNARYRLRGPDNDKKCLPGDSGSKGPFSNIVKHTSTAQAILPGFYRAARGGSTIANMFMGKMFYNLQYMDDGDKLRCRFQQNYPKEKLYEDNSCSAWNDEKAFIPKIYGMEYPDIDEYVDGPDETRVFMATQWKFFRCCKKRDGYYNVGIFEWINGGDMVKE